MFRFCSEFLEILRFFNTPSNATTKSRDSEQTSFCARYSEKGENSENY
jgi:hypothetical protein